MKIKRPEPSLPIDKKELEKFNISELERPIWINPDKKLPEKYETVIGLYIFDDEILLTKTLCYDENGDWIDISLYNLPMNIPPHFYQHLPTLYKK